jgi:arylsulfatase A-like enzyme
MDLRAAISGLLMAGCTTPTPSAPTIARQPNIVLISLDTLRADRLTAYGGQGRTPNLDRLAAESVVFSHTYAQATETLFSHASLFTSRYPSELGPVDYTFQFPSDVPTLAEVLGVYGYATGAFVGGGHLSPAFGLQRGFDRYLSPVEWGSLWHTAAPALDWIDGVGETQPFFLFLHGYDAHSRYLKPTPVGYLYADASAPPPARGIVRDRHGTDQLADGVWYRRARFPDLFDLAKGRPWDSLARETLAARTDLEGIRFGPTTARHVRDVYDGAASYADLQFGLFMAELADRQLLDHTWIVVISDHGESLGEDGLFNHRLGLSEAVLRVPLLVRPPGGLTNGRTVEGLSALLDVMPTLLDIAQSQHAAGTKGRSLLPAIRGEAMSPKPMVFAEAVFREIGAITATGGLVLTGMSAHSPQLGAALRLASPSASVVRTWGEIDRSKGLAALRAWRSSVAPSPGTMAPPDPARTKALQDKGYWGPR